MHSFIKKCKMGMYIEGRTHMADITSVNNATIKNWRKLHTKKERKKMNRYIVEGFHLVEEALKYKEKDIIQILIREDLVNDKDFLHLSVNNEIVVTVNDAVAEALSETETNQGIFAILKITKSFIPSNINRPLLLLDAVQDPGNVGTLIRTADAAGFHGVILGEGTVDLYNAKTLRSAQGSHFHLEVYDGSLKDFIIPLKEQNVSILGTALNKNAESFKNVEMDLPFALIVGNEGSGISDDILPLIDKNIYIPMKGHAESLNVAIAASIIMFHLY